MEQDIHILFIPETTMADTYFDDAPSIADFYEHAMAKEGFQIHRINRSSLADETFQPEYDPQAVVFGMMYQPENLLELPLEQQTAALFTGLDVARELSDRFPKARQYCLTDMDPRHLAGFEDFNALVLHTYHTPPLFGLAHRLSIDFGIRPTDALEA